jgi:hypothetical protein
VVVVGNVDRAIQETLHFNTRALWWPKIFLLFCFSLFVFFQKRMYLEDGIEIRILIKFLFYIFLERVGGCSCDCYTERLEKVGNGFCSLPLHG